MNIKFYRNFGEDIVYTCVDDSEKTVATGTIKEVDDPGNPVDIEDTGDASLNTEIRHAFEEFKNTPEYTVLSRRYVYDFASGHCELEHSASDAKMFNDLYCKLIAGCAKLRSYRNPKSDPVKVNAKIGTIIKHLCDDTDFFVAPASTYHHEAYRGGLVVHTLNVVANVIALGDSKTFANTARIEDAVLVALVHDWCKIGNYIPYMKNVKNEETGQWEKVEAYRYNENAKYPLGHGLGSAYYANKFFRLSDDEFAAIVFHMGNWESQSNYQQNSLMQTNNRNPLAFLLQFADQVSLTDYWAK